MDSNNYICLECGKLFDYPQQYEERHGFITPPYETYYVCPHCGGAYMPIMWCEGCGEAITGYYVRLGDTDKCYCDSCFTINSIS